MNVTRLAAALLLPLVLVGTLAEGARLRLGGRRLQSKSARRRLSKGGSRSSKGGGYGGGDCGEPRKPHKHGHDDLGIRFNKFRMLDNYHGYPVHLTWKDFPMSDELAYKLSHYSNVESVMTPHDYETKDVCIEHYIAEIGGYPSFPSRNPKSYFWKELDEVVEAQRLRRMGKIPDFFVLPDLWRGWSAEEVAEAVHDEYPGLNHAILIDALFANGMKVDHTCIPYRSKYDFVGEQVRFSTLNTWSIGLVGPTNFYAKHHVGRPRPEEIAWLIYKGRLTRNHGVPQYLIDKIKSQPLDSSTSFTAYPEGSPTHPAWPAMHSAASSASLWLAVVADLTEEEYCQVLRTDFAVAYARTVAGVHYPTDNIAGLNMGQQVIAENLAHHMAYTYGGEAECYQEKIDKLRFDWNTFNPRTCKVKYRWEEDEYW